MTIWALDPEISFLNHGSFGACPRAVLDEQTRLRDRLERQPITFLLRELPPLWDAARETIARFVDADAEDLVRVANATEGVNTVLASLHLAADDEVLITSHGYNACNNAARARARVVVAEVPFPIESPDAVVDAVLGSVTPRTKIALLDHVTSPTGLVFPIERLVAELHGRGVQVLVDGAHAPGMLPLSLRKLGADYYTGNLHKWVCAPKAAGFLWVRRDLQANVHPLVISHGANAQREDRSRYHLEFDWPGTFDPTPWLCVPMALDVVARTEPGGWPDVMRKNRELALAARHHVLGALGAKPAAPDEMIGSLVAMLIPGEPRPGHGSLPARDLHPIQERLTKEGIEVPVYDFGAPPRRVVRISAQRYNDMRDYERLAKALVACSS